MNALAENYEGQDFEVLLFPSNIFGKLEPGSGYDEIMNGVTYVRPGGGFIPQATFFEKVEVNGENEPALYTFLKSTCPYVDDTYDDGMDYSPVKVGDVHWNFEKFLVGKDGKVYYRYHSRTVDPADIMPDIDELLNQ